MKSRRDMQEQHQPSTSMNGHPHPSREQSSGKNDAAYYNKGSTDIATLTRVTLKRLETRRKLTCSKERLVIVLVGLPGRGKSFVARKLLAYLEWRGTAAKIFNVGKYRRQAHAKIRSKSSSYENLKEAAKEEKNEAATERIQRFDAGSCDANFFDDNNEAAATLREEVAALALEDMLNWLDNFPATPSVPGDRKRVDSFRNRDGPESSSTNKTSRLPGFSSSLSSLENNSTDSSARTRTHQITQQRIAIFDATNSTRKRRKWILEECTNSQKRAGKHTGIIFLESVCDDEELLEENYRFKIRHSPDFRGMSEEQALNDLKQRVKKYEDRYETIDDDSLSYIKVFNLSSKVLVNHIYGRMAKVLLPFLISWNIGTRSIYLCRSGKTDQQQWQPQGNESTNLLRRSTGPPETDSAPDGIVSTSSSLRMSSFPSEVSLKSLDSSTLAEKSHSPLTPPYSPHTTHLAQAVGLGRDGCVFRDSLCQFIFDEGMEFMRQRDEARKPSSLQTGTSVSGLTPLLRSTFRSLSLDEDDDDLGKAPFPCYVMSSTMPRAVQTATWSSLPFIVNEHSNLNPLDKGDFAGKELEAIRIQDGRWYEDLQRDPFRTRFPGGECYGDLINRLEPCVIDMEQQVGLVVVVSHVSVIQVLMAYFRHTPVERCTSIEVPLHTVVKFTPARGGGWAETHHPLPPNEKSAIQDANVMGGGIEEREIGANYYFEEDLPPIWGDHETSSHLLRRNRPSNHHRQ